MNGLPNEDPSQPNGPPSDPNDPNDPVDGVVVTVLMLPEIPNVMLSYRRKRRHWRPLHRCVKASDAFTPFGNSVQVVKYGDDGSQVVIDNSGMLLWGRSTDEWIYILPIEGDLNKR